MNEIKFRTWSYLDQNMCYHDLLKELKQVHSGRKDQEGVDTDFEFLLAIGKKDINGRELYDGDIVRTQNSGIEIIEFRNQAFRPKYRSHLRGLGKIEYIGNIYEDPELIK